VGDFAQRHAFAREAGRDTDQFCQKGCFGYGIAIKMMNSKDCIYWKQGRRFAADAETRPEAEMLQETENFCNDT
jgi:hypothetical protein